MKNFNIMQFLRGRGVHEIWGGGESPKKRAWIVCRFKRGLGKREKKMG